MSTRELADDLERLARGQIDAEHILQTYRSRSTDPVIDHVLASLGHFAADADTRSRDPAYREMQFAQLDRLIALLRGGAPLADIARITFIGAS